MISLVVVTLNESNKLVGCLESVKGFADEIVIMDLESADEISEICKKFKVKLFRHPKVDYVEKVRQMAIDKALGDWVLVLDPDERLTEELKGKLKQILNENKYVAVNIPRKNIFFNRWIAHTNWWPDRHIRFFQKGKVGWPEKIHSYPKVSGQVLDLEAKESVAIEHFGYQNYQQVLDRQKRYAMIEAQNLFEKGEGFSIRLLFWKPLREFLARFIKHQGYLDGIDGLFLVYSQMFYWVSVEINLWKLQKKS